MHQICNDSVLQHGHLCVIIFLQLTMVLQTKIISDQNILTLIAENNTEAWRHLYDKYAHAMFGIIYNLTKDRTLAEEIFEEAFLQLKESKILSKNTYALCSCLLRHTHSFAQQQLKERGINNPINPIEKNSLITIFCSQNISLREVAAKLNISEKEVKENLRAEFLALHSKNEKKESPHPQKAVNEQYAYNFNSNNKESI